MKLQHTYPPFPAIFMICTLMGWTQTMLMQWILRMFLFLCFQSVEQLKGQRQAYQAQRKTKTQTERTSKQKLHQELLFDSASDKTAALSHSDGSLKSKSHLFTEWICIYQKAHETGSQTVLWMSIKKWETLQAKYIWMDISMTVFEHFNLATTVCEDSSEKNVTFLLCLWVLTYVKHNKMLFIMRCQTGP